MPILTDLDKAIDGYYAGRRAAKLLKPPFLHLGRSAWLAFQAEYARAGRDAPHTYRALPIVRDCTIDGFEIKRK